MSERGERRCLSIHLKNSNQHAIPSWAPEEITREIQTLGKMLFVTWMKQIIIHIGASKEGDILVGKVTPKGEKDTFCWRTSPSRLWR